MKLNRIWWPALIAVALGCDLYAAEPVKPVWLTDCSVSVKESYDNNVFLSGVNAPPAYTVPSGSVAALRNSYSWITAVSPKFGVDFAPLLGATNPPARLTLSYAPDFVRYHHQDSENYDAHRVLNTVKAGAGLATLNADNSFSFIDGNHAGPLYPGNLYSGFATISDRARRRQLLEAANLSLQFDFEQWFFRPAAALLYNDMMTELRDTRRPQNVGYQNYADRADVNGGADVGCQITSRCAVTLGYRYGQQYEEQYSFSPYSAPNRYQRVLLGFEGSPWSWLNAKLVSGPDFRDYAGNSAAHTTPVNNLHPVKYYGEALLSVTLTKRDALTFKYKYWQWLAGTGKVPYTDGAYELTYHRQLADKLGLDVGGKFMSWDFDDNNPQVCRRHDLQYTASGGLTYALNRHVSINSGCVFNWGRNDESDIANPGAREYNQALFTVGTTVKF